MTDHAKELRALATSVDYPSYASDDLIAAADHIDALTAERDEARSDIAELTGRLDPYVERNHDDGGTHAEALDSLIADAERYSEARATLDAITALVGPGDVVERVRALTLSPGPHLYSTSQKTPWKNP